MFNSGQHNTRIHNGNAVFGIPYECFADTRQVIAGHPAFLLDADCRQLIGRGIVHEARTYQIVYAVLRDETHVIQV
mgnify:CR=1 FL=1